MVSPAAGRNHQAGSGLCVFRRRGIGHRGSGQGDGDGGPGPLGRSNRSTAVGRRFLDGEATGDQRSGVRREFQSGLALGQSDEAAVGDRRRAVILIERSAGDAGDLEVAAELSLAPGVITRPEVVCVFSVVVALVTVGPPSVTVIVARTVGPLNPLALLVVDSWTVKPPGH